MALRKRQQEFLRFLVDSGGSRIRAVENSGVPLGTVLRWQSDPWYHERYREIRQNLAEGDEALRDSLTAASFGIALGTYDGLMKSVGVRRGLEAFDNREAEKTRHEDLEAQIRELLDGDELAAQLLDNR